MQNSKRYLIIFIISSLIVLLEGFAYLSVNKKTCNQVLHLSNIDNEEIFGNMQSTLDPIVCGKFKILTCSATSCAAKRKALDLNEFATFSALYERIQNRAPTVQIEESSCLGSCKKAPCVAIEHDEYDGTVALEGMDDFEFSARVFHRVIDNNDADRVWSIVENAISLMDEED